mmetsp:Transcript_17401/g.50161  ORF Transcript_17401/g.50161 Transcript_17401/m.50161 type:complete len:387 (+) Transcript_17401:2537-3697(+)
MARCILPATGSSLPTSLSASFVSKDRSSGVRVKDLPSTSTVDGPLRFASFLSSGCDNASIWALTALPSFPKAFMMAIPDVFVNTDTSCDSTTMFNFATAKNCGFLASFTCISSLLVFFNSVWIMSAVVFNQPLANVALLESNVNSKASCVDLMILTLFVLKLNIIENVSSKVLSPTAAAFLLSPFPSFKIYLKQTLYSKDEEDTSTASKSSETLSHQFDTSSSSHGSLSVSPGSPASLLGFGFPSNSKSMSTVALSTIVPWALFLASTLEIIRLIAFSRCSRSSLPTPNLSNEPCCHPLSFNNMRSSSSVNRVATLANLLKASCLFVQLSFQSFSSACLSLTHSCATSKRRFAVSSTVLSSVAVRPSIIAKFLLAKLRGISMDDVM